MICKAFCSRIKDVIHHQCHKLYTHNFAMPVASFQSHVARHLFSISRLSSLSPSFVYCILKKLFLFVIISKYHSYLGSVQYCKYNPALGLTESCEREISLKYSARIDLVCFFLLEFSRLRLFS